MPDVLALEEVLTHQSLGDVLSRLSIRSFGQQMKQWVAQKRSFKWRKALIKSLGKPSITDPQSRRFYQLQLGYDELKNLYAKAKDVADFRKTLKDRGVHSKALLERLPKMLKK